MITIKAEQIGKKFRKFNGDLNIEVDGKWINLPAKNEAQLDNLVSAINKKQLVDLKVTDDGLITELNVNPYKNIESEILKELSKVYRHG